MNELTEYKKVSDGLVVDHLDYKHYHVDFYEDPLGSQYYCFLDGNRIDFGTQNTMYKEDLKRIIDFVTNRIKYFPDGARLEWFPNGRHMHLDIRLIQWGRILKVYLVEPDEYPNIDLLTNDAEQFLKEFDEKTLS